MLLVEALASSAPDIDRCLAPLGVVDRLVEASRGLSSEAAAAYIETRVDPASDQVDLLVCMLGTGSPRAPASSAGVDRGWALAESVQESRRTEPGGLRGESPLLWLEFDDAGRSSRLPSPSVCVCVEPGYLTKARFRERAPAACESAVLCVADLAGLAGPTVEAVLRSVRTLPAPARLIHLSVMCARSKPTTKLYLRLPIGGVTDFLARIGWDGDRRRLATILDWRRRTDAFLHVDVSIDDGVVLSRLGLAFPRDTDGQRFSLDIFEGLVTGVLSGRALQRVREAGEAWIRKEPMIRNSDGWRHVVHRWIDQKIVIDGREAELKLYLAIRPMPLLWGGSVATGGC